MACDGTTLVPSELVKVVTSMTVDATSTEALVRKRRESEARIRRTRQRG
jgi:hypothetical protein